MKPSPVVAAAVIGVSAVATIMLHARDPRPENLSWYYKVRMRIKERLRRRD